MGYLLALAFTQAGRTSGFARLGAVSRSTAGPQIQEALKNRPGFNSSLAKRGVKAERTAVLITWTFSLSKTKLEDVVNLFGRGIEELSKCAPPSTVNARIAAWLSARDHF